MVAKWLLVRQEKEKKMVVQWFWFGGERIKEEENGSAGLVASNGNFLNLIFYFCFFWSYHFGFFIIYVMYSIHMGYKNLEPSLFEASSHALIGLRLGHVSYDILVVCLYRT